MDLYLDEVIESKRNKMSDEERVKSLIKLTPSDVENLEAQQLYILTDGFKLMFCRILFIRIEDEIARRYLSRVINSKWRFLFGNNPNISIREQQFGCPALSEISREFNYGISEERILASSIGELYKRYSKDDSDIQEEMDRIKNTTQQLTEYVNNLIEKINPSFDSLNARLQTLQNELGEKDKTIAEQNNKIQNFQQQLAEMQGQDPKKKNEKLYKQHYVKFLYNLIKKAQESMVPEKFDEIRMLLLLFTQNEFWLSQELRDAIAKLKKDTVLPSLNITVHGDNNGTIAEQITQQPDKKLLK